MQDSTQIMLFDFQEKDVRVTKDDIGQPWFVAKDIAELLDISWSSATLDSIPENWKKVMQFITEKGVRNITVISEAAVYKLAFRSRKEEAEKFTERIAEIVVAIRQTGSFSIVESQPIENDIDYTKRAKAFKAVIGICEIVFDDKNQALLAANNMIKRNLSFDWLAEIGATKLIAPVQERYLTVTELAKQLNTTAVKLNKELEKAGFQKSTRDHKNRLVWNPTDEGKKHSVLTDTGKQHSDGKPVQQLHWYPTVLEQLKQLSVNH